MNAQSVSTDPKIMVVEAAVEDMKAKLYKLEQEYITLRNTEKPSFDNQGWAIDRSDYWATRNALEGKIRSLKEKIYYERKRVGMMNNLASDVLEAKSMVKGLADSFSREELAQLLAMRMVDSSCTSDTLNNITGPTYTQSEFFDDLLQRYEKHRRFPLINKHPSLFGASSSSDVV